MARGRGGGVGGVSQHNNLGTEVQLGFKKKIIF